MVHRSAPQVRSSARPYIALSLLLAVLAAEIGRCQEISIVSIEPVREDSLLVCTLNTDGLPDAPSVETLESGLPSALVVALALIDRSGHELGGSRAEIRIEPDLWEEEWVLRTPRLDLRLSSIEEVAEHLARLGPLPVLPIDLLSDRATVRIRARLAVHPLAPAEILKVRALFGGQGSDPDRREVSVGLGSLIRVFLGGQPEEDWVAEAFSPPFTPETLGGQP